MGSRKWSVDFTDNSSTPSSRDIQDPHGFTRASHEQEASTLSRRNEDAVAKWKCKKLAWEETEGSLNLLFIIVCFMWMFVSTVNLFSVNMTFSSVLHPLRAFPIVGKVFEPFKGNKVDLFAPKLVIILQNLGVMLLGV